MTETRHTPEEAPLPWIVYGAETPANGDFLIADATGEQVAQACTRHKGLVNAEEIAAFIVRACNAHDDMLATLEAVEMFFGERPMRCPMPLRNRIRAAIEKATSGAEP